MNATSSQHRKNQRAILTLLREFFIFGHDLTLLIGKDSKAVHIVELDESNPRDLTQSRVIKLTSKNNNSTDSRTISINDVRQTNKTTSTAIQLELNNHFFLIPLNDFLKVNSNEYTATFSLNDILSANRRRHKRASEPASFYTPILFYHGDLKTYPIPGFARLIDFDSHAVCVNLQFFTVVEECELKNGTLLFQEPLLGLYDRQQTIANIRNFLNTTQGQSTITKVDAILNVKRLTVQSSNIPSVIQPNRPLMLGFICLLHEQKTIHAPVVELFRDGFYIDISAQEAHCLPSQFQVDHDTTKIRFHAMKLNERLFISYSGLTLGNKTIWFNFLTKVALGYDHCFTAGDSKRVTHLMFESGNYTSSALLQIALLNDAFQHKWPLETAFSPTKYRWFVRNQNGDYIGHTAAIRVSEKLWGAIDNIGSQQFEGSWNAQFVARFLRAFAELIDHQNTDSYVQWSFVPSAGVWQKFDEAIKRRPELTYTRDRFWVMQMLNYARPKMKPKRKYIIRQTNIESLYTNLDLMDALSQSQKQLLSLLAVGIQPDSSFQNDFSKEHGYQLTRFYYVIECAEVGSFLLTFTNYPAWASLHKGHDWDYIFPFSISIDLSEDSEIELLAAIDETVFKAGCRLHALAIVHPTLRLTRGVSIINLTLRPSALALAAETVEQL